MSHPVHFATIAGVNIVAANLTPPSVPLLHLAGAAGKASLLEMLAPKLKFLLIGCVPAIPLVMHVPDLALFLPWVLLDVSSVRILGQDAEAALARTGITSNKNPVAFDARNPARWTGLRLGFCTVTTRGLGTAEMDVLGECIADLLHAARSDERDKAVADATVKVAQLAAQRRESV